MKKLFALLFIAWLALPAGAANIRVTAAITLTNTPADGDTVTVNGDTRTWKSSVTDASSQILIGGAIGPNQTNLFTQFGAKRFNPFLGASLSGTNTVNLIGNINQAIAITLTGTWGTYQLTTNPVTAGVPVVVPIAGEAVQAQKTNITSDLVFSIGQWSTNAFPAGAIALSNFMTLTTTQVVSGGKLFTAPNTHSNATQQWIGGVVSNVTLYAIAGSFVTPTISGGALTNAALTNITQFSGSNGIIWALILVNPVMTNGQNYGAPFRSPGAGLDSEQFGIGASAAGQQAIAFGDGAAANLLNGVALGAFTVVNNQNAISIGSAAETAGVGAIAIGFNSAADASQSVSVGASSSVPVNSVNGTALGASAVAGFPNSTAVGHDVNTTATNQIRIGLNNEFVAVAGGLSVEGSISNSTFSGINNWTGDTAYVRKNNTSLANGANAAVDCSTNIYVKLSGPSGAFTINGIAGGRDGRVLILQNSTGFTMTIANASGVDPMAANRILTNTGADVANASNPGTAMLIYDSGQSRWILLNSN